MALPNFEEQGGPISDPEPEPGIAPIVCVLWQNGVERFTAGACKEKSMRITVLRRDGTQEILDLPNGSRWTVRHGRTMSRLHSDDGFDHYFNFNGSYDGWGGALYQGCSPDQSQELLDGQEELRRFRTTGGQTN